MDGAVVERIMGEVRKTKVELESDMAALRAFTQQAVGGEGDLWQLQVVVLACVRVHVCTCVRVYVCMQRQYLFFCLFGAKATVHVCLHAQMHTRLYVCLCAISFYITDTHTHTHTHTHRTTWRSYRRRLAR